jgi:hypothetical protein
MPTVGSSAVPSGPSSIAPSRWSALTSSVTNSGLPPALVTCRRRLWPGLASTRSSTICATAAASSGPRTSSVVPFARSPCRHPSSSADLGTGRAVHISSRGSCRTRRPRRCSTNKLDGSAHCRSSTAIATGFRALSSSTRATTASTVRNSVDGLSPNHPSSPSCVASSSSSRATCARLSSALESWMARQSTITPNGRRRSSSSAAPRKTRTPRSTPSSSASTTTRVFPIPASPVTRSAWPIPPATCRTADRIWSSSAERPTRPPLGSAPTLPATAASPKPPAGGWHPCDRALLIGSEPDHTAPGQCFPELRPGAGLGPEGTRSSRCGPTSRAASMSSDRRDDSFGRSRVRGLVGCQGSCDQPAAGAPRHAPAYFTTR